MLYDARRLGNSEKPVLPVNAKSLTLELVQMPRWLTLLALLPLTSPEKLSWVGNGVIDAACMEAGKNMYLVQKSGLNDGLALGERS